MRSIVKTGRAAVPADSSSSCDSSGGGSGSGLSKISGCTLGDDVLET